MYLAILHVGTNHTVHTGIKPVVLQCVDGVEMSSSDVVSHLCLFGIGLGNNLACGLGVEKSVGAQKILSHQGASGRIDIADEHRFAPEVIAHPFAESRLAVGKRVVYAKANLQRIAHI